jgi:hypothetical protein
MNEIETRKNHLANKASQRRYLDADIARKRFLGVPVPPALQALAKEAGKAEKRNFMALFAAGVSVLVLLNLTNKRR